MVVLLDTNVLISAVLFGGLPRRLLRAAILGRVQLATSSALLAEFEELLRRKFGFSHAAAAETRGELEVLAVVVEPGAPPRICRDPDDDEVLAAAIAAHASVIVTGDRDLLAIGSFEGIEIIRQAVFAKRVDLPD